MSGFSCTAFDNDQPHYYKNQLRLEYLFLDSLPLP